MNITGAVVAIDVDLAFLIRARPNSAVLRLSYGASRATVRSAVIFPSPLPARRPFENVAATSSPVSQHGPIVLIKS